MSNKIFFFICKFLQRKTPLKPNFGTMLGNQLRNTSAGNGEMAQDDDEII